MVVAVIVDVDSVAVWDIVVFNDVSVFGDSVAVVVSRVEVIVVTGRDDTMTVVMLSDFGARITNFNTRERVVAIITRTKKDTQMILTRGRCHRFCSPVP